MEYFYFSRMKGAGPERDIVGVRQQRETATMLEEIRGNFFMPESAWVFGDGRQLFVAGVALAYRGPEIPLTFCRIILGAVGRLEGYMTQVDMPVELTETVISTLDEIAQAEPRDLRAQLRAENGKLVAIGPTAVITLPITFIRSTIRKYPGAIAQKVYNTAVENGLLCLVAEPGMGKSAIGRGMHIEGLAIRVLCGEGREPWKNEEGVEMALEPRFEASMRGFLAALTLGLSTAIERRKKIVIIDSARPVINMPLGTAGKGGFDRRLADQFPDIDSIAREAGIIVILTFNLETDDPVVAYQAMLRLYGVATLVVYLTKYRVMGKTQPHPVFEYEWVAMRGGTTRGITHESGFKRGVVPKRADFENMSRVTHKDMVHASVVNSPASRAAAIEAALQDRPGSGRDDPGTDPFSSMKKNR